MDNDFDLPEPWCDEAVADPSHHFVSVPSFCADSQIDGRWKGITEAGRRLCWDGIMITILILRTGCHFQTPRSSHRRCKMYEWANSHGGIITIAFAAIFLVLLAFQRTKGGPV
jgi:hypothetical protein